MAEKALRIASLLAGVSGANVIELSHWARAQAITERWRGGLYELYRQLNEAGYSEERNIEDRLLSVIQRKGPSTKRDLRNFTKLSTREIERALSNLEGTGIVEKTDGPRTIRYSLTEESEEA
jgi:DNA-binding MarR family transcriptional regulator